MVLAELELNLALSKEVHNWRLAKKSALEGY